MTALGIIASAHVESAAGPTYFFEDYFTGTDGAAWDANKWPYLRNGAVATIDTNRGKLVTSGSPSIVCTDIVLTDFELTLKFQTSGMSGTFPEIGYRVGANFSDSSASAMNLGYCLQVEGGANWHLFKIGSYATLATVANPIGSSAATYWFKIRCVGNSHKIRWWADGGAEPSTWNIDITDSSYTRSGVFYLASYGSGTFYWDNVTIENLGSAFTLGSVELIDGGYRTVSAANLNVTDQTWIGWIRNTYSTLASPIIAIDNGGSEYFQLGWHNNDSFVIYANTGDWAVTSASSLTAGLWYFFAVVRTSTGVTVYYAVDGAALSSNTNSSKGTISNSSKLYIGGDGYSNNADANLACIRIWTAALTSTEIEAERASQYTATRTSSLYASFPFNTGQSTVDASGNGHTLERAFRGHADGERPPFTAV